MRVIVAGSKDWPYPSVVTNALELCAATSSNGRHSLTVVHPQPGNKRGPEAVADAWALAQSYRGSRIIAPPERHPPHWYDRCRPGCQKDHRRLIDAGKSSCPQAGYHRIDDMVGRPTDLALIFITSDRDVPAWLDYLMRRLAGLKVSMQEFRP